MGTAGADGMGVGRDMEQVSKTEPGLGGAGIELAGRGSQYAENRPGRTRTNHVEATLSYGIRPSAVLAHDSIGFGDQASVGLDKT